jgi:phage repressor protein C with HTH and peptisase S24 domain
MADLNDNEQSRREFSKRLNEALDAIGFPPKGKGRQLALGRAMKISQKGARKWLEGEALPTEANRRKLVDLCKANYEWLFAGRGEHKAAVPLTPPGHPVSVYHPEEPLTEGEFLVPAVNLRVGAGSSIVSDPVEAEGVTRYSLEWAHKYGLKPDRLIRYRVRGDSMEPIIRDRAWILVEMGDFPIQDGMLFLIRAGEDVQVKFLFKRPDGGVIIRSHNPANPDVILTAAERGTMGVLGRVVESVQMWVKPHGRNGQ